MHSRFWTFAFATHIGLMTTAPALDLVRDGKPVSTIVIPDNASDIEQEAARKLADYLAMASGAELPIARESSKPGGTVISLGKTGVATATGVAGQELRWDGYHLRVNGGTLFVFGRDGTIIEERNRRTGALGSLKAVLGLLEQLGFRWLQPTPEGLHVPRMASVSVPDDLNITHQPVFMYVAGRMYTWGDWSLANSFRKAVAIYSAGGHTWDLSVPISLWEKNPDYFRMQGGKRVEPTRSNHQVCSSNPNVVRLITEFTLGKFAEGYELVALGQPDGFKACECPGCAKLAPHDQVHNVQRQVTLAARRDYPDRFVHMLVYGPTVKPPTQFTSYPPNTMTEVCLTGSMELEYGSHGEALDFWQSLIPGGATVYVYYMGMYHGVGMGPKFTPRMASDRIRMLADHDVKGIYFCGGGENWGAAGPTYYVIGRLATDPAQEWRHLVDEYCDLTFRNAGRTMRQYYSLLYERIDAYYARGLGGYDLFTAMFTPEVLDRLANFLALARQQSAGDARALGWIECAEISYRHFAGIAEAYHLYQTYQLNPTPDNLAQLAAAVDAYDGLCKEIRDRWDTDRGFFKNYFPNPGLWIAERSRRGTLKDNMHKLSSPFTWNFDVLRKTGFLPGKTRSKTVVARLPSPPRVDGDPTEDAWNLAPWIEVRHVSLGQAEAATRLRLGYDEHNLYVAFECREPLMDEMKVIAMGRDGKVYNTECVEVFLAPDGFGQKRVQLVVSPSPEGRWDGRYGYIDDPLHPLVLSGRPDTSWDPDYPCAYRIDSDGQAWTVEMAIPFAELGTGVPEEGTRWRGNFGRERHKRAWDDKKYAGQIELSLWSPNLQGAKFTDPAAFGDIYFARDTATPQPGL